MLDSAIVKKRSDPAHFLTQLRQINNMLSELPTENDWMTFGKEDLNDGVSDPSAQTTKGGFTKECLLSWVPELGNYLNYFNPFSLA